VSLGHCRFAAFVESEQVALPNFVEVRPGSVEVDCGDRGLAVDAGPGAREDNEWIAGSDDLTGRHEIPDRSQRIRRDEHMLHFHRFEHDELIAGTKLGALGCYLDHSAGQLGT
jgi:hypothetical protein